jgi:hypothetical protein
MLTTRPLKTLHVGYLYVYSHSILFILHDMLYILIVYLLYILDTILIRFVFQVTQEDQISSLMMAGYCRNM